MAMLETLKTELDEAAVGRFFDASEPRYVWTDLAQNQANINDLTDLIRLYGVTDKTSVAEMETAIAQLTEEIANNKGWLVAALPRGNHFAQDRMRNLVADYSVTESETDQVVVFIPSDSITALKLNPQIYGTGEAINPVMHLRVKTTADKPQSAHNSTPSENLGTWFEMRLETTPLALLAATPEDI